jgi:predicted phosphodiesterase
VIIAVFSDVHGNLSALECFINCTKGKVDQYICLGDVVNYGPWNDECLELVLSLPNIVLLEGNHERLFLGLEPIEREIPLVQEFYASSIKYFSRYDMISNLQSCYRMGRFLCAHTISSKKIYADTDIQVDEDYMIGHTHHQFIINRSGKNIINCGSIGQNRGDSERLNYALFNTVSGKVSLHAETYPLGLFIRELEARGYSQYCINYYLGKKTGVIT